MTHSRSPMTLALNVYCWTPADQQLVLTRALGPELAALRAAGAVRRLWFCRFDARGPHLFVALTAERPGEVAARLEACLALHFARYPPGAPLGADELRRRHDECRGKTLCAADAEPGFAAPGSFRVVEQPAGAYPFGVAGGGSAELWGAVADVSLWSVEQLAAGGAAGAAVRWVAGVARALEALGEDGAAYWRHHAETLLVPLAARLRDDEAAVLAALPTSVGERNARAFAGVWEAGAPPLAAEVARRVAACPAPARHALLREVNHGVLQQLGQPVALHVPLVLYAWHRALAPGPEVCP